MLDIPMEVFIVIVVNLVTAVQASFKNLFYFLF